MNHYLLDHYLLDTISNTLHGVSEILRYFACMGTSYKCASMIRGFYFADWSLSCIKAILHYHNNLKIKSKKFFKTSELLLQQFCMTWTALPRAIIHSRAFLSYVGLRPCKREKGSFHHVNIPSHLVKTFILGSCFRKHLILDNKNINMWPWCKMTHSPVDY